MTTFYWPEPWVPYKSLRRIVIDNHKELMKRLDRIAPTDNQELLDAVRNLGNKIMAAFDDLKTAVAAYTAKVDAYIANQQADIAKLIADAVAADDAGEEVDLKKLQADVEAASTRVPAPVFVPSGNG